MVQVVQLNCDFHVLSEVSWQRAVTLLVDREARPLDGSPIIKTLHSPSITVEVPLMIVLNEYRFVPYQEPQVPSVVSFANILRRDLYTCIYCGSWATTVDHIKPKARGGLNTWDNLAAACESCNFDKGCRTPAEAGLSPLWTPAEPVMADVSYKESKLQKQIWRHLERVAV